jgi:hypothetical protein
MQRPATLQLCLAYLSLQFAGIIPFRSFLDGFHCRHWSCNLAPYFLVGWFLIAFIDGYELVIIRFCSAFAPLIICFVQRIHIVCQRSFTVVKGYSSRMLLKNDAV